LIANNLALVKRMDEAIRLRDRAIESSVNAILITSCNEQGSPIVYVNPANAGVLLFEAFKRGRF